MTGREYYDKRAAELAEKGDDISDDHFLYINGEAEIIRAYDKATKDLKSKIDDLEYDLWKERKVSAEYKSGYDKMRGTRVYVRKLLNELKQRGIIRDWSFNGGFHWEI